MELSLHGVKRVVISEPMENNPHHFLIIQTQSGEKLKIDLYNWNGEIDNEIWTEACAI